MTRCLSRVFDVSATIPVTVRVEAEDADAAMRIALRQRLVLMGVARLITYVVGWPETLEAKEVEPGDVPVK